MDPLTFDRMIQRLSGALSRRSLVGGSLSAALLEVVRPGNEVQAKKRVRAERCLAVGERCPKRVKHGKKKPKHTCDDDCCTRYSVRSAKGKRRCACREGGEPCTASTARQCCSGECQGTGCAPLRATAAPPPPVCPAVCPTCQTCNTTTGRCEADPAFLGQLCGAPGQVCQANGTCTCDDDSCPAGQVCNGLACCTPDSNATTCAGKCGTVQNNCRQTINCTALCTGSGKVCIGLACCTPDPDTTTCAGQCGTVQNNCRQTIDCTALCGGCCTGDGRCQPGTGNAACGPVGGTCDICAAPDVCFNRDCCTPVNPTCGPTSCNQTNNCGQLVNCCGAAGAATPGCEGGACCEQGVGSGTFCSATVPCCQMGQAGSRRCRDGQCCVNSGFPTANANQCCSGVIQGNFCT